MKMLTRGGAICGNWETGLLLIASIPKKMMATEMAIARTGL
jgi:hypothetical protein